MSGPDAPIGSEVTAPPPSVVRSPMSDGDWHRLHPLTPLLRGGVFLLVLVGIVVANLRERLAALFLPWVAPDIPLDAEWNSGDPIDWILANNLSVLAALAVLLVLIVLVLGSYVSWRFHTFRITGDQVEVRSGILFRTHRRAPLDRVQGVNLTRPMIARLFGMAKLEVVGAGTDANVRLEYLSTGNAEAVRSDILRLASGRHLEESAAPATTAEHRAAALGETVSRGITGLIEGEDTDTDEPASVVHIPVCRLVLSHLLGGTSIWLLLLVAGLAVAISLHVFWPVFAVIPALIAIGAYWVRSLVRSLRYAIAPTPNGVRMTVGLFTTVTEIVPPGRVHALEVSQPLLWRPAGWWRVRINRLSGRSLSQEASPDAFTTALPVGTLADVDRVVGLLMPSVSVAERSLITGMIGQPEPEPESAGVEVGSGDTHSAGFVTTPRRAWFFLPLSWRRNGVRVTGDLLLMRRGMIWRSISAFPLARLQSVGLSQGPVSRAARVAGVRAHTIAGPVSGAVIAIDRDEAVAVFAETARNAIVASAGDRSHRWAQWDSRDEAGSLETEGPPAHEPEDAT